jgi:hypothetical protein
MATWTSPLSYHCTVCVHIKVRIFQLPALNHFSTEVKHVFDINIYRNLRTQQMSVLVLLCTSYTTCFGPCWWALLHTEVSIYIDWYTRNRMHNPMIRCLWYIYLHTWLGNKVMRLIFVVRELRPLRSWEGHEMTATSLLYLQPTF